MAFRSKHILVIRLSAMGDVAIAVPVIRTFTLLYPHVKVTVLTRKFFLPFFKGIANVAVVDADVKGRHKGMLGLFRLFKELNSSNIDAVADLHSVIRSKFLGTLFRLSGVPVALIHKGRSEKKALTREKNKVFKQLKTSVQRYADVFERLGYPVDLSKHRFPEKIALTAKITSAVGAKAGSWVGIAPFAQHKSKMYPWDLMQEVIAALAAAPIHKILLFGAGGSEGKMLAELASRYPNVLSLAGVFSLEEELAVISNLDLMLSMDSGNAHMAAMFGVQVVTLWGGTHPYAGFYPFGQEPANALLADRTRFPAIPFSVYGNKVLPGYEDCMRTIAPQEVVQKVLHLL